MTLVALLSRIVLIIGTLLGVSTVAIVGRRRLRGLRDELRPRVRGALPYLVLLGAVLLLNGQTREFVPEVSWFLRVDLTGTIYGIEGTFVAWIQQFATAELTAFFSFVYVYGYVLLLTFPIVAYLALGDQRPLREACLAYSYNYALGLVCYTLFIAYGPRNMLPDVVDSLMYTNWPESQLLTSQINTNTNVFPSLHTSLSATTALLAVRTRRAYPAWLYLSVALAACVAVSTMYLGIHWGIDVLAGAALGAVSVVGAREVDVVALVQDRTDGRIARRGEALWDRLRRS